MRMSAESIKSFHGASSHLFKKISYFSIPLPKPQCFLMCCLCPQCPVGQLSKPVLLPSQSFYVAEWSGISCSSMAMHLGWFRCLLPIGKGSLGDRPLPSKLSDFKEFSKSSCSCKHLRADSGGILCSFSLQHSVFGEPSQVWAACPTSWKTLHAIQTLHKKSSSTFLSNPSLLFHKWHR